MPIGDGGTIIIRQRLTPRSCSETVTSPYASPCAIVPPPGSENHSSNDSDASHAASGERAAKYGARHTRCTDRLVDSGSWSLTCQMYGPDSAPYSPIMCCDMSFRGRAGRAVVAHSVFDSGILLSCSTSSQNTCHSAPVFALS